MSHPRRSLKDWLCYLEDLHPTNIELGLERVNKVKQALQLDFSNIRVVTVGGTNGKGTTSTLVEQACIVAGQSVAVYSSPHLIDYRERVRINGKLLTESMHCDAFKKVELARGTTSLTYFEFGTLAALLLIAQSQVDIALLEVGLGGRLDAVNIIDPNLSVITTIDLDHQDWLGDTKEAIGREKAGIFRQNRCAIIGDLDPPLSLIQQAEQLHVQAQYQGQNFRIVEEAGAFSFVSETKSLSCIPTPHIPLQNVATGLAVIEWLDLGLSDESLRAVVGATRTPGRMQQIGQSPDVIVDVAHNIQAVNYLKTQIETRRFRSLHLVCAMLKDKDIEQCLAAMSQLEATWYLANIDHPRGAQASYLAEYLDANVRHFEYDKVEAAFNAAVDNSNKDDLVVVFGSFFTLSAILDDTHLETNLGFSVTK